MPGLDLPNDSDDSSDSGTEVEIEISTPRLCTPEFDALRQKFPIAFRRRTSLASVCSDASSIYSGSMIIGAVRSRRSRQRSRTEGSRSLLDQPRSGGLEGLPPRPPPKEDMSIKGGKRTVGKAPKGILKKDESPRGYHERGKERIQEQGKMNGTETGLSLKERLRRNREEMRALLAEERLPFRNKVKEDTHKQTNGLDTPLELPYTPKESIRTLQELQNQVIPKPTTPRSPRTRDGRTLLDHLKSGKHARSKRFESPDSAHDSAVDMDSASTQSNPSSDNYVQRTKPKIAGNLDGIKEDRTEGIPSPVLLEEEVIEPIQNARAPKLKSARRRGRSPSPLTVHNVNQMQQQRGTAKGKLQRLCLYLVFNNIWN